MTKPYKFTLSDEDKAHLRERMIELKTSLDKQIMAHNSAISEVLNLLGEDGLELAQELGFQVILPPQAPDEENDK